MEFVIYHSGKGNLRRDVSRNLITSPIKPPYQPTPSTHSTNTPYQHFLPPEAHSFISHFSTHPFNTLNSPYQLTYPTTTFSLQKRIPANKEHLVTTTHPINTLSIHPANSPILSTQPINVPSQLTLSTNTPYQTTPSTRPLNPPYQLALSTNLPYHHFLPPETYSRQQRASRDHHRSLDVSQDRRSYFRQ